VATKLYISIIPIIHASLLGSILLELPESCLDCVGLNNELSSSNPIKTYLSPTSSLPSLPIQSLEWPVNDFSRSDSDQITRNSTRLLEAVFGFLSWGGGLFGRRRDSKTTHQDW